MAFDQKILKKINSEKSQAMTANCYENFIVLKNTDFATQNGLISTDLCLNILRTQSTALGTMMRGRAVGALGLFCHQKRQRKLSSKCQPKP